MHGPSRNDDARPVDVQALRPYGVGIDTHKEFIQVCVLRQRDHRITRIEREFSTTWPELQSARAWAVTEAGIKLDSLEDHSFRYTIESTGTYHIPVLLAWRSCPSVVNPMLAGQTKRKTDVLDARMLAQQAMSGLWPLFYLPSRECEVLRILMNQRQEATRNATRSLNRINNNLLRFGHTIGREGSMADVLPRSIVEDLCHGLNPKHETICPDGIPMQARPLFMDLYTRFDHESEQKMRYHDAARSYARTQMWPTGKGMVDGATIIKCLQSCPGIGEVSAITWLSIVYDPRRFESSKHVAAFCGCDPSLKVSAGKVTSHVKRKGNAKLHHILKNVAAQVVRRKNDPLGLWGYAIMRRNAKGGWARAINAVSRRLAVFLWHVHSRVEPFAWDKYKLIEVKDVPDLPIEEMGLGKRYESVLKEAGMLRSTDLAKAIITRLPQEKGVGAGCLNKVRAWLSEHQLRKATVPSTDLSSTELSPDAKSGSSLMQKLAKSGFVVDTESSAQAGNTKSMHGVTTKSPRSVKKSLSRSTRGRTPPATGHKSNSR